MMIQVKEKIVFVLDVLTNKQNARCFLRSELWFAIGFVRFGAFSFWWKNVEDGRKLFRWSCMAAILEPAKKKKKNFGPKKQQQTQNARPSNSTRRRKQSSAKKCKTIGLLCLLVHTHTQDCSSSFYRIWFMATFLSIELNSYQKKKMFWVGTLMKNAKELFKCNILGEKENKRMKEVKLFGEFFCGWNVLWAQARSSETPGQSLDSFMCVKNKRRKKFRIAVSSFFLFFLTFHSLCRL